MPTTQTRPQKAKVEPRKMTDRGVTVAVKSKQAKAEARPIAGPSINAQERERFVAQAAYFRAEKRGFAPGYELQDWVEAEAEVLRLIGGN
jgi:hypothetical protein